MARAALIALLLASVFAAGALLRSCRHLRYSPLYHPDVARLQVAGLPLFGPLP
jgi:hypothetical protein